MDNNVGLIVFNLKTLLASLSIHSIFLTCYNILSQYYKHSSLGWKWIAHTTDIELGFVV